MPHPVDNRQKQTWRPPRPTRIPKATASRIDRRHDVEPEAIRTEEDRPETAPEPETPKKTAHLRIPSRRSKA